MQKPYFDNAVAVRQSAPAGVFLSQLGIKAAVAPASKAAYIYALIDPRDNAVRYIGKTFYLNGRHRQHCKGKGATRSAKWIRHLASLGLRPTIEVVEIINTGVQADWENAERQWVANFKLLGYDLTNLTEGGDSGWSLNPDAKRRIGDAQRGKKKPSHVGIAVAKANKERTPDQKAASNAKRKENGVTKRMAEGYKMAAAKRKTEEYRRTASEKGRLSWVEGRSQPIPKECYARIAEKLKGQKRTPEQKARIRESALLRFKNDPDLARRHSEKLKGRKLSPESISKREATRRAKRLAAKEDSK